MWQLPIAALLLALAFSRPADAAPPQGPSFDCAKAATPVEHAICADPNLSAADRALARNYTAALAAAGPYRNDLTAFQRAWLKRRAPECGLTPSDPIQPPDSTERTACLLDFIKTRADSLEAPAYGYLDPMTFDPPSQPPLPTQPPLTLWLLHEAFAELPFAPQAAEHVFAGINTAPAQLGRLMAARLFDPPSQANTELQQTLAERLSGENVPNAYDGSIAGLIAYMTYRTTNLALPCALFEEFPDLIPATGATFGSSRDNSIPHAVCSNYEYPFPHIAADLAAAAAPYDGGAFGRCTGTIRFAAFANDRMNELISRVVPNILLKPVSRFHQKRSVPQGTYVPPVPANIPLEAWSYQSVWNRHAFAPFKQVYEKALAQFITFYETRWRFQPNDAEQAARVAIWLPLLWTAEAPAPKPIAVAIMGPDPAHALPPLITDQLPETKTGEPLLSLAAESPVATKLLLAAHADANAINDFGKTPLMTAAQFDQAETISLLLQAGARINQQSIAPEDIPNNDTNPGQDQGVGCSDNHILHGSRTALMYAAANATLPTIRQLLTAGADKTLKDSQGQTAADYLQGKGPVPPNPQLNAPDRAEALKLLTPP